MKTLASSLRPSPSSCAQLGARRRRGQQQQREVRERPLLCLCSEDWGKAPKHDLPPYPLESLNEAALSIPCLTRQHSLVEARCPKRTRGRKDWCSCSGRHPLQRSACRPCPRTAPSLDPDRDRGRVSPLSDLCCGLCHNPSPLHGPCLFLANRLEIYRFEVHSGSTCFEKRVTRRFSGFSVILILYK